ncbi:MAG: ribonuclease J [Helicobacteraceae bacterium]
MEENKEYEKEQSGESAEKAQAHGGSEQRNGEHKNHGNFKKQKQKSPGWYLKAKDAILANKRVHQERLSTHSRFGDPSKKIKVVPLGGLDQIGGNMTVFETDRSAVIVDVGLSFPSSEMHGVDILIPDFTYLASIRQKIKGILITHAHEDHIGAVAYLFKKIKAPIYGSPLALAMVGSKFDEHQLSKDKSFFRYVEKRRPIKIDDFEVEWIHITHSVIDASSLAITTDAGTIIHTGDFKIDNTPIDEYPIDFHRLAFYGERGVLALFSDSTNSFKEEMTKSESVVGKTFDNLFANTKGRVIMSTFSSNIHRVYQAIASAKKYGRKVAIIGRSMEKNLNFAMDLEYIKIDKKDIVEANEKLPDSQMLIITTGSQGEPQSALFRMSVNEHRHIKLKPTDTVIISAKAIPGNENSVSTIINQILKTGASVAYQEFSEIHVSGHASIEEQKLMIRLVKPKFFIPAHGEYQHILKHSRTAMDVGVNERNIILLDDGDAVELSQRGYKRLKKVKSGKVFVNSQINKEIENSVVYDRQILASDGVVLLILQLDKETGKLRFAPSIMNYGLVSQKKDTEFVEDLKAMIDKFVENIKPNELSNPKLLENNLRQIVKKYVLKKFKKYPIVTPVFYVF